MNESRRNETPPPIPVAIPVVPVAEPVVVPPQVQPMQVPPQVQVAEDTEEDPYDVEAQPERKKMTPAMKLGAVTAGFAALLAAATANKGNVPEPSIDDLNGNKSGGAAVLATGEDGLTPAERAMIEDASLPGIEGGGLDPNLLDLDYLRANNIGGNYDFAAHVEHWKIESEVALRLYAEVVRSPGDNEDMNDYMNRPNDGIEMVWGNDWKTKIGGYTEGTHTEYNIGRVNVVENGEEGYIYYGFSRDFGAIDGSKVMPGSVGMAYEMGFASTYEESERLMTTFVMGHMMPSDDSDRVASRDR